MPKVSARVRLTRTRIDKATRRARDYILWDSEVPGFGVRVATSGRRTFVFQYFTGSRSRRITLGGYGVVTPEQARQAARTHKQRVLEGHDPAAERNAARSAETVSDLCKRFLEEHSSKKKERTRAEYARLIGKHVLPELGKLRAKDVQHLDISRLHRKLRGTPYQANRVLAVLSKMFSLSETWGVRKRGTNPCSDVERYKENARERFLSEEELCRLGATLRDFENEGRTLPSVIAATRLLILTGARLDEILSLRWEHVDQERALLRLSDSKTGQKVIHLSKPAMRVLKAIPRSSEWVIVGQKAGAHLINLEKPWRRIRERAGIADVRLHDLRHSYAALAAEMGTSLLIIGALLGHKQPQTTKRYAHLAASPVRQANDDVGRKLAETMEVESRTGKPYTPGPQ